MEPIIFVGVKNNMKRVYVIMCDAYDEENNLFETKPVDVVSTMTDAERLCFEYETENPECVYYWHEVISSED